MSVVCVSSGSLVNAGCALSNHIVEFNSKEFSMVEYDNLVDELALARQRNRISSSQYYKLMDTLNERWSSNAR